MSKNTIKADINFEQELWKAANELCGTVAKNQYKDYMLPMVFLKHMLERYEMPKEELTTLLQDKTSSYFTTDERAKKRNIIGFKNMSQSRQTLVSRLLFKPFLGKNILFLN